MGAVLARELERSGDEVVFLSRKPEDGRSVGWDGRTVGAWADVLDGADVLINLAGRSVNCRYDAKRRREIKDSRLASTRVLGEALARVPRPPAIWLQASTATIYTHRHDAGNDERTGVLGGEEPDLPDTWRFSVDVARSWERAALEARVPGTRQVLMRSAMVMSPDRGGIFDTLLGLVRRGLGGKSGDGRQYVSWIHHEDFVRAVRWLIEHDGIEGPVNLSAPAPLPNSDFMRALRQAWGMRLGLPANRLMLEAGALGMRTETELVPKSRRVVPGRLVEEGFSFRHPEWPEAARELCGAWRANRAAASRTPDDRANATQGA